MNEAKRMECILLVEDDDIANFLSTKTIEKLEITNEIVVRTNGLSALEYLRENQCPDLIILDINMPVMNGLEFLEAFQQEDLKNKDKTKIVVLSSTVHDEDIAAIHSYGIEIVDKPLTFEKMMHVADSMSLLNK